MYVLVLPCRWHLGKPKCSDEEWFELIRYSTKCCEFSCMAFMEKRAYSCVAKSCSAQVEKGSSQTESIFLGKAISFLSVSIAAQGEVSWISHKNRIALHLCYIQDTGVVLLFITWNMWSPSYQLYTVSW